MPPKLSLGSAVTSRSATSNLSAAQIAENDAKEAITTWNHFKDMAPEVQALFYGALIKSITTITPALEYVFTENGYEIVEIGEIDAEQKGRNDHYVVKTIKDDINQEFHVKRKGDQGLYRHSPYAEEFIMRVVDKVGFGLQLWNNGNLGTGTALDDLFIVTKGMESKRSAEDLKEREFQNSGEIERGFRSSFSKEVVDFFNTLEINQKTTILTKLHAISDKIDHKKPLSFSEAQKVLEEITKDISSNPQLEKLQNRKKILEDNFGLDLLEEVIRDEGSTKELQHVVSVKLMVSILKLSDMMQNTGNSGVATSGLEGAKKTRKAIHVDSTANDTGSDESEFHKNILKDARDILLNPEHEDFAVYKGAFTRLFEGKTRKAGKEPALSLEGAMQKAYDDMIEHDRGRDQPRLTEENTEEGQPSLTKEGERFSTKILNLYRERVCEAKEFLSNQEVPSPTPTTPCSLISEGNVGYR